MPLTTPPIIPSSILNLRFTRPHWMLDVRCWMLDVGCFPTYWAFTAAPITLPTALPPAVIAFTAFVVITD